MATINFDANKNSIEGKSQVILRTNPALSSNVKLVVDSSGDIFLDSFSANKTLSNQKYKRYSIDPSGHYAYDLAAYYKNTPLELVYEPLRRDSDTSVYKLYNKQYEEQYNYGARLNSYNIYSENIRFMAPLKIDKVLPEYFVIYRIEEPVSDSVLTDELSNINTRLVDMLSNATIVKTFDLRPKSKVGQYLNTFANNTEKPIAPLTFSFEKNEKTLWNGIDLVKGGFASKGEYVSDNFIKTDNLEILNNQFITEGFKRNSLVSADVINLEFLFEDFDNAYDVPRYIGIYVNEHEEGSFKHTDYRKDVLYFDNSTVETNFDLTGTSPQLTAINMLPYDELDLPILQWVKFNNGFGHVKNLKSNDGIVIGQFNVAAFNVNSTDKFIKKNDTLNISGIIDDNRDFIKLSVVERPDSSEHIILAATNEVKASGNIELFKIYADSALAAGTHDGLKYSNNGSLEQITFALRNAMNSILDSEFKISLDKTNIIISNYISGNRVGNAFLAIKNDGVTVPTYLNIETSLLNPDIDLTFISPSFDTDYTIHGMVGGSAIGNSLLIEFEEIGDLSGDTYIKSGNTFAKVIEVVADPVFDNKYRVCVDKSIDSINVQDSSLSLWIENKVTFGKFEAFDFVDFDFDFFSTMHSKPKELQYEDVDSGVDTNYIDNLNDFNTPSFNFFKGLENIKQEVTITSSGVSKIYSEYDRLQENYIKELALTSRIIPTINKWRYLDGVNVRENPYMLSMSEAFGKTNFAPNIKIDGTNADAMTHEWYYIYGHPNYYDATDPLQKSNALDFIKSNYSYLQPELSIELDASKLMDINNDWFNSLFVYDGFDITGVGFAPAVITKKYTTFVKGSVNAPAETMFRGLKVKAFARKEFTELNPKNLINTAEFNDYKFSAVLNYKANQSVDDSTIKVIQNKEFKTITIYIEVLTTEQNALFVNRKLLYHLKSFSDSFGNLSDTKINGYLDFSVQLDNDPKTINVTGVGVDFIKDIQINEDGGYNVIKFDYANDTWVLPVISVENSSRLTVIAVDGQPGKIQNESKTNFLAITQEPSTFGIGKDFTYIGGGYNLAKATFESISTKSIVDLLNLNDTEKVEYITVETDGTINNNRFILNIEDGHYVKKQSKLTTSSDPNKPETFKVSAGKVGYVVNERDTPYTTELIRMSGDYTPLTRTVVSFTDMYRPYKTSQIFDDGDVLTVEDPREKILYNRYNRMGIVFGSAQYEGHDKWGVIENLNYHKINPEKADGILKLSNSTTPPVYRLISEIAIDKRDVNVFRSSWEDEYYIKNGIQNQNINVYGTLSAYEESAFLASTLNLPKNQYEITSYPNTKLATGLSDMKAIKSTGTYNGDVVLFEDNDNVYIDLYLGNRLTNVLIDDNAGAYIKKYVLASNSYGDKTTLDDDIKKYIEVNMLKLLNINEVRLFNTPSKQILSSEVASINSLNDILDSRFVEDTSFRLEYDVKNPLNIKVIYNKRPGFKHQFYIYTKINS